MMEWLFWITVGAALTVGIEVISVAIFLLACWRGVGHVEELEIRATSEDDTEDFVSIAEPH